jgi:hypothetical protein
MHALLQVNLLSEICNDEGTQFLPEAATGATDKRGQPMLWQISTSKVKWPYQQGPPKQTWNLWKRFL